MTHFLITFKQSKVYNGTLTGFSVFIHIHFYWEMMLKSYFGKCRKFQCINICD